MRLHISVRGGVRLSRVIFKQPDWSAVFSCDYASLLEVVSVRPPAPCFFFRTTNMAVIKLGHIQWYNEWWSDISPGSLFRVQRLPHNLWATTTTTLSWTKASFYLRCALRLPWTQQPPSSPPPPSTLPPWAVFCVNRCYTNRSYVRASIWMNLFKIVSLHEKTIRRLTSSFLPPKHVFNMSYEISIFCSMKRNRTLFSFYVMKT